MEVDVFGTEVGFENVGALVIQSVELGFESRLDKYGVDALEGCEDYASGSVFHWLHVYVIRIMGVHDEDVLHALAEVDWQSACLIRVDRAIGGPGEHGCKAGIRAVAVREHRR